MGLIRKSILLLTGAGVATLLVGCAHDAPAPLMEASPSPAPALEPDPVPLEPRRRIETNSQVTITRNGFGGYDFRYTGADVTPKGNFDLAEGRGQDSEVLLTFCLADKNYKNGVRFMQPGTEAIWIEFSEFLEPGASPDGPYAGDQFMGFETTIDGRCAQVVNLNDDSLVYFYALRFRVPGEKDPVAHDPIIRNGPRRGASRSGK